MTVESKMTTVSEVTRPISQSLNVQAPPWLGPVGHAVGLTPNDRLSLFQQSAPAPSSRSPPGLHCPMSLGVPECGGACHGSANAPISAISFQPPGFLSSTSQGALPTLNTNVAPMQTIQTTRGIITTKSTVVHGPAASAIGSLPFHVPGVHSPEDKQHTIIASQSVTVPSNFPAPIMSMSSSHPAMSFTPNTNASLAEFAQVMVRCQGSKPILEEERYSGDPLRYHQFMRQVEDRILNIYANSDPGHALQLLLNSTTGRARKLIGSCITLRPTEALNQALELLYNSFGSPAVAVKAHLKAVCESSTIREDERSLQDFYSDLVNCKLVVETANSTFMLDSVSTSEGIFTRLPKRLQRQFAEMALRKGYDMEIVPFDLYIEFVDQVKRLSSSRLGRLMNTSTDKTTSQGQRWSKSKPSRVHSVQSNVSKISQSPYKATSKDKRSPCKCPVCDTAEHWVWRCPEFTKESVDNRRSIVKEKRLCFNCLGVGHGVKDCPSKARCRTCAKTHHSLLHPPSSSTSTSTTASSTTVELNAPANTSVSVTSPSPKVENCNVNVSKSKGGRNRLQVLPVTLVNPSSGIARKTWALLDSGADTHLLSAISATLY